MWLDSFVSEIIYACFCSDAEMVEICKKIEVRDFRKFPIIMLTVQTQVSGDMSSSDDRKQLESSLPLDL